MWSQEALRGARRPSSVESGGPVDPGGPLGTRRRYMEPGDCRARRPSSVEPGGPIGSRRPFSVEQGGPL